jgi:hypothetical protein
MYSGVILGLWINITTVEVRGTGTVDKIKITSLPFPGLTELNGAVVTIEIGHIYANRFLFPFPAHDYATSDAGKYLQTSLRPFWPR